MPATREALLIALFAIAPGWIALQAWARNKTWSPPTTDLRTVLQTISVSLVIQLITWPIVGARVFAERDRLDGDPNLVITWAVLVVIIVPVAGGVVLGRLSDWLDKRRLQGSATGFERGATYLWPSNPPSAWDAFFDQGIPSGTFLTLTLENGTKVAGAYGNRSYATTSPHERGLYLETEWLLDEDGYITDEVPGTKGILIHEASKIKSIRVQLGGQ